MYDARMCSKPTETGTSDKLLTPIFATIVVALSQSAEEETPEREGLIYNDATKTTWFQRTDWGSVQYGFLCTLLVFQGACNRPRRLGISLRTFRFVPSSQLRWESVP